MAEWRHRKKRLRRLAQPPLHRLRTRLPGEGVQVLARRPCPEGFTHLWRTSLIEKIAVRKVSCKDFLLVVWCLTLLYSKAKGLGFQGLRIQWRWISGSWDLGRLTQDLAEDL